MAVYRFSAKIIGRSGGKSACAAAAYRAGERIMDERTGLEHDYRRRSGVLYTEIITPENTPEWMQDRSALWNAAEAAERRKDAQLAREVQLSLPHELEDWQRVQMVQEFVRAEFVDRGMIADIAVHAPDRQGDERNHHAHVMLTLRDLTGEGFGPKNREWNASALLEHWRERWADFQNRFLERAGSRERVDHRSYEAQGIDKEPEPKLGPTACKMEREGKASERGDEWRAVKERNAERERLKHEVEIIDLALEREKHREQKQRQERAEKQHAAQIDRRARKDAQARAEEREARKRGAEQGRFAAWANRKRAALDDRHYEQQGRLGEKHSLQKLALEDRLERTYGQGRAEAQGVLDDIADRQQRSGFMGLVYRLTGQAGRDQFEAQAARSTLANIAQREGEQRDALTRKQGEAQRSLLEKQEGEGRSLEKRIRTAYERREREGWEPLPDRDRRQERASERPQDAPQGEAEQDKDELKQEWTRAQERANDNGHEEQSRQADDGPGMGRERTRDGP